MGHDKKLVGRIRELRSEGKTYGEINSSLGIKLAKSTLSWMCKDTSLPKNYTEKISDLNIKNLGIARATAIAVNKIKKEENLQKIRQLNLPISEAIFDKNTAKIALAMLCLGEASKSKHKHAFSLGNSDHRIIILFIKLLEKSFAQFDFSKIRAAVQCRADQDISELTNYWQNITGIPKSQFYRASVDPRTIGKPTKKKDYKGVLNVYYSDKRIQLELESLADLVYNFIQSGPVVHK